MGARARFLLLLLSPRPTLCRSLIPCRLRGYPIGVSKLCSPPLPGSSIQASALRTLGKEASPMEQVPATVLVYSDDKNVREQVRLAAGRRPAADVPQVEFLECATQPAVLAAL